MSDLNSILIKRRVFDQISGIIATFMTLAIIVCSLKYAGHKVMWGFQFQNQWFLITMSIVMIFFALNLFNFFSINLPLFLVNYLNKFNFKKYEDFFSGVLMTIFSTPCTAPFVGTAIIYAFSGGYDDIFLIFLMMAIGLSFPLIILLFFPNILKILPKTGDWVLTFKKIMGVSFLISGIWLFSIYSGKLDNNNQTDVIKWETWHLEKNPDLIKKLVAQKKIIFLDITADWCITCKYNKIFILNNKNITQFIKSNEVVTLQMDWTKKNKYIENFIFSKNRFGIPYNEIYSKKYPNGIILGELLDEDEIIKHINDSK